ncbi:MAG: aminodeoxychorismate synthase component I [Pseudomonadota bacterium]
MEHPHIRFQDDLTKRSILFENPSELIFVEKPHQIQDAFSKLEKVRQQGKWTAGFVAYEAGFSFEEKLRDKITRFRDTPLFCFGIFDEPKEHPYPSLPQSLDGLADFLSGFQPCCDYSTYKASFNSLREHIAKGDCYQGNLTFPIDGQWTGSTTDLFDALSARQPVRYGAHVALCEPLILSRSPELFFKVDRNGWIETHPMKGTAPRRSDPEADLREIELLKSSTKTQAENVMIVDLLRNDISRVTDPFSLHVPKLFEVESYPSVHQMISCIRAKLNRDVTVGEIFRALFPCGSITGAPKLRVMEILNQLEPEPRGIYCGAIGYIGPGNQMLFNVAIRTLALFNDGTARLNVGGGIVWDSVARDEYDEALLKAKFVTGNG